MRYTNLLSLDQTLRQSKEYAFRKVSLPIPGENLTLEGLLCIPNGRSQYYFATEHPKERILLHFTAGNIRSDLSVLTTSNRHVSVPFVISRDGTIYQLFSSKFWSGNIGKGIGNTNTGNAQDKVTIAIELSNYGFLTELNGNLETYYSRKKDAGGNPGPVDIYCSLNDTEAYEKLSTPFRGQSYYASFTEEQYSSLIVLLRYLTTIYKIPREFLPAPKRYEATEDVLNFRGIVSHVNYRNEGKWDIGPAFNWQKVIHGVQAIEFSPAKKQEIKKALQLNEQELNDQQLITSEDAMVPLLPEPKDARIGEVDYPKIDMQDEIGPSAPHTKPKLYGLLVGIADYKEEIKLGESKVRFPQLLGCVKDAEKIKTYLEQDSFYEPDIKLVTNEHASKEEIVRLFREHLGKAEENDTAIFYFSGHGTQEYTDSSVFTSETDGKLESMVCYYDESTKENFLLADKELRWLINEVASKKPHVVTIFDCCHSAGITRNGALLQNSFDKVVEKRAPFVFPQREWEQFIFSEFLSRGQISSLGEHSVIKEGMHIQLSACESNESAVEVAGEGAFTKALLKVLKASGGNLTYYSLRSRIRQYLQTIYEQKPRLYVTNNDHALLYAPFLNKPIRQNTNSFGEITFNENLGWLINLGALHGIHKEMKSLKVFDPANKEIMYNASLGVIKTDSSQLNIEASLDKKRTYFAYVEALMSQTIRVCIAKNNAWIEDQQKLADDLLDAAGKYIVLEDNEQNASYVIQFLNGRYYITYPNDPYRPLAQPVEADSKNAVLKIVGYLKHISNWEFIKGLTNQDQNNMPANNALGIEIAVGNPPGELKPLSFYNGKVTIDYAYLNNEWQDSIKIRLTNNTKRNLYCSALYLVSNFQSFPGFLNPAVYLLEAGNSVELGLQGKNVIQASLDQVMKWYNWEYLTDYLKIIVSTELFDADALTLEQLQSPPVPSIMPSADQKLRAGLVIEEVNNNKISGWYTQDIELTFKNPEYNIIGEEELELMLEDESTADFALGIYYDGIINEDLQTSYIIKPSIQLKARNNKIIERGFIQDKIIDAANLWARARRNRLYKKTLERFPHRIKIVAEGDSWFQHPLVLDIIDHLSRTYAVYCTSAAGDTLRNYFSAKKRNGEYYLEAIDEQEPSFFLISGEVMIYWAHSLKNIL